MQPKVQSEMEAVVVGAPSLKTLLNPTTLTEDPHLVYEAEVQYKRKPPEVKRIMCSSLDTVNPGEPVMIVYHHGMRCYKHSRQVTVSNAHNCIGGFYFTDGTPA